MSLRQHGAHWSRHRSFAAATPRSCLGACESLHWVDEMGCCVSKDGVAEGVIDNDKEGVIDNDKEGVIDTSDVIWQKVLKQAEEEAAAAAESPTPRLKLKAEKWSAHSGGVYSVAFSPDGKTIVSGADDKTIKVWDAGASALIPLNPQPKADRSAACCSIPGAQGGEKERAQQSDDVRGLLARRQDHRLRLRRQDAQSVGCRCQALTPSNP